jgi:predicted transcriptional regulator
MALQLVTTDELTNLKEEILKEVRAMFQKYSPQPYKKWIKSNEVRELLKISPGTLQALRVNGTLKFTKVGGIIYYERAHVQELLEGGR